MDKNLPLESLRGLAAIIVALSHAALTSVFSENVLVKNASWMVDFFFVLSGYVIALNYIDRLYTWSDLKLFQLRRFYRLYPLHFFTLLAFLGIECVKYWFEQHTGIIANNPAFSKNDISAFIHNLFLTHSILISRSTFNAPSWSISTEFYTYFIFGILAVTLRRVLIKSWLLVILACFVCLHWQPIDLGSFQPLVRCIFSFFIGAITWLIASKIHFTIRSLLGLLSLVMAVGVIMVFAHTQYKTLIPFFFGIAVLAIAKLPNDGWLKRLLSDAWLVYLGTISYSIYLNHLAVWWLLNQVLRFIFKVPTYTDLEGNIRMTMDPALAGCMTVIGVVLIVIISGYTYQYIENRFKKGLRLSKMSAYQLGPAYGIEGNINTK